MMKNNPLVFYHKTDFDGMGSAAIIKLKYPNAEFYPINYGYHFPFSKIKNRHVIMVDFSLQNFEDMIRINDEAASFVWIDHHIGIINESNKYEVEIYGSRRTDIAAIGLTWEYYFPELPIPTGVKLLSDFDIWNQEDMYEWDSRIYPYQLGLQSMIISMDSPYWANIFSNDNNYINDVIKRGTAISDYKRIYAQRYMEGYSYETTFEGYRALVINAGAINSNFFDSKFDENEHDLTISYVIKKGKYYYSVSTPNKDINVAEICKKYGGGGHMSIGGFQTEKPIID